LHVSHKLIVATMRNNISPCFAYIIIAYILYVYKLHRKLAKDWVKVDN